MRARRRTAITRAGAALGPIHKLLRLLLLQLGARASLLLQQRLLFGAQAILLPLLLSSAHAVLPRLLGRCLHWRLLLLLLLGGLLPRMRRLLLLIRQGRPW